jgi:hypothetical protein
MVRQLHQDDADVVDHGEQHLAEILRLALLARGKRDGSDLGDALDQVGHFRAEQLADLLDRRQGVLDHVVQEAGDDGSGVEAKVGEEIGHLEGMDQVGLPRLAHLAAMGERRKDVGPAQQLDVAIGHVGLCLRDQIFESDHRYRWCRMRGASSLPDAIIGTRSPGVKISARFRAIFAGAARLDSPLFGSLYWPGSA